MSDAKAVLDQLNLVVDDVNASVAFYRMLGLEIPDESVWGTASGAHHVEMRMPGGFSLELDSVALARHYNCGYTPPAGTGSRTVLSFRMPSREAVDETSGRLVAAGHRSLQPPYDTFWGARYAIVEDPDRNHVGLMSRPDPARRSAPPSL